MSAVKEMGMENWKTSADLKAQADGEDVLVRKAGIAEAVPASEGDLRRVKFVVSTSDVDRDNDTIDQAGWDLSSYKRNPVVLFAHSHYDLPIGKCVSIEASGGRLVAEAEFATHAFADTVYQLIKGGFLNATSVGFRALEYVLNESRRGVDFKRQELLEFSVVPVPANQNALVAASAAGIDLAPMKSWIESVAKSWPGGIDALFAKEDGEAEPVAAEEPAEAETPAAEEEAPPEAEAPAEDEPGKAADGIEKRGRVLSASNERRLREAMDMASGCMGRVKEVLDALQPAEEPDDEDEPDEDDEEPKAARQAAEEKGAEIVLELDDEIVLDIDEDTDDVGIEADDVRSILREVIAPQIALVARDVAERTLNQMRGRVD